MHDYRKEMKMDIKNYLYDNYGDDEKLDYEEIYDKLFSGDSVTGNASGSYTFNTYVAEENLAHNLDLLTNACNYFAINIENAILKGAENCDVLIRCYLLDEILQEVFDEI